MVKTDDMRLVLSICHADEPEAIPTVELTGTREALTWLTGRILAIASSADESYEYLDEVDLRALSISSKRVC